MAKLVSADLTGDKLCTLTYTTTDGKMLSFRANSFDANILIHSYTDKGEVIFDKPITFIGDNAFYQCKNLASITIPDSITLIGKGAFVNCRNLKGVIIPNSVTKISKQAFRGCNNLDSVTIPDSVSSIGECAFSGCNGNLIINSNAIVAENYDHYDYSNDGILSWLCGAKFTRLTIGNNVTKIGNCAFCNCSGLTSITIPDSVADIGERAFVGCRSLKTFYGKFSSDEGRCLIKDRTLIAYAEASGSTYIIPNSINKIGDYAFEGCDGLVSITIPNSITEIGEGAFVACKSLTTATIPNSVTSIGMAAFYDCIRLTNITIPDSVVEVGLNAFAHCEGLTSVTICKGVVWIGSGAFHDCSNLKTVICKAEIPPKLEICWPGKDCFPKFETLIVPEGSEEAYLNSDWRKYIVEEDESGTE